MFLNLACLIVFIQRPPDLPKGHYADLPVDVMPFNFRNIFKDYDFSKDFFLGFELMIGDGCKEFVLFGDKIVKIL